MSSGLAAFAVLAYLAYLASRVLARRHLPELVGFLLVGALLGPSVLGLVDEAELKSFQPITQIALAILMFVIGERVSTRALRQARWALTAGLAQFAITGMAMFVVAQWIGASRSVSLMLATLAAAGAPATIAHVVTSARASGPYADGLIGTHAVSDALTTTAFAAVLPVATLLATEDPDVADAVIDFFRLGVGGFVLGVIGAFIIARLGRQIETSGELLLFVLIHLLVGWALTTVVDVSLPLAALVAGAGASSISPVDFSQRLFRAIRSIEQPVYLLFFALAGAGIHLEDIPEVGLLGLAYIVVRSAGKVVGGFLGGVVGGLRPGRAYQLGIDMIPQAGVAVGLAALAAETLPEEGGEVATVVLGSVVLFELIGPLLVARGLRRESDKATNGEIETPEATTRDPDAIPERVLVASTETLPIPTWIVDNVARWGAELVVLVPGEEDDDHVQSVRDRAKSSLVDMQFVPLRSESFTGMVVRTVGEVRADYVVLLAPRPADAGRSRLVLFPSERIARQLDVPVTVIPTNAGPGAVANVPERGVRTRRGLSFLRR